MLEITVEQRRARLARRHRLTEPAESAEDVARALVVLHATDPATVHLSAAARLREPSLHDMSRALYDDRTLVRVLAMRRTLFVVPLATLDDVERSSAGAVARNERRKLETWLADTGIDDPGRWLADVAAEVEAAVGPEGATARVLTSRVPRLTTRLVVGRGTRNETTLAATSRVLLLLALEGLLLRGRPSGSWTGRQYTWQLRRHWLGRHRPAGAAELRPLRPFADEPDPDASAALVERWLRAFGPASEADLKWWTGWPVRQVRAALAGLDTVEVKLADGGTGLLLADDVESDPDPGPWAALLPALDPTPMGWQDRAWFLGAHRAPLFDRSGNIGPTVWVDGRIVGGWGQRPDGAVSVRLLEDVGTDHRALIDQQVDRLQSVLESTVVKPSFPTPLQKELSQPE